MWPEFRAYAILSARRTIDVTIGPAWPQNRDHGRRHDRQDGQNLGRDRQAEDKVVLLEALLFGQEDGKAEGCDEDQLHARFNATIV